jgi:hypothetical protein
MQRGASIFLSPPATAQASWSVINPQDSANSGWKRRESWRRSLWLGHGYWISGTLVDGAFGVEAIVAVLVAPVLLREGFRAVVSWPVQRGNCNCYELLSLAGRFQTINFLKVQFH